MPLVANTTELHEWRCFHCRNLLAKINLAPGSIVSIKCKCNAFNEIAISPSGQSAMALSAMGNIKILTTC